MKIKDLKRGDQFRLPDNPHVFRLIGFSDLSCFYPDELWADVATNWGTFVCWPMDTEVLPLQLSLF